MMSPSAFQDSTNLAHHRAKSVKGAAPKSNWLVWARAIAPNMLSGVVAHDDGKVSWQHFCSEEATDLSDFQISTVAYTPEGQLFVAGCRDGKIRIWDSSTGRLSQTLSGHGSDVRAVAVSPQGNWLASGDQSGEVRLWSISDGESSEILSNYCAPISSLAFSGDGQTVAVATAICPKNQVLDSQPAQIAHATDETGCRGLVAFWNLLDRVEIKQIKSYSPLAVVAFSLDSNSLSGAEWSGRVLTWNIGSTELLTTRFIDRKVVAAAAFASDGQTIRPKL